MTTDTLIIGGGLSGLYAAYLLQNRGNPFLLVEARPQLGGRIRTRQVDGHPFELGPSWFWPDTNPRLASLIEKLALPHFDQHTNGDALIEDPAGNLRRELHRQVDPRHPRRLAGGTKTLIQALSGELLPAFVRLPRHATAIREYPDHLCVTVQGPEDHTQYTARNVILAVPPRLAAASIRFTPELPPNVQNSLRETPTWMAGDAKFFAIFDQPFWRHDGLSGSAFSEVGPLSESHDASLPDGPAALCGFLIPGPAERAALADRLVSSCLDQLARYFGPAAAAPRHTLLQDWSHEEFTATADDVPLFTHPAYGLPESARTLWDNRLHFAATECAPEHGGYMEGALEAAENAIASL